MKKILALILVLSMLMLCACGKKTEPETTTTTTQAGVNTVRVTFREGLSVYETAKLLEENNVCPAADFVEAVNHSHSEIAQSLAGRNRPFLLEGYVFPDTYEFYIGESASSALSRFLQNTNAKITDSYRARAAELGYSMDEILALASIIQKEAGIVSEMNKVSSVLHNRLKKNMRLDCDVTYFYLEKYVMGYYSPDEWDDDVYERYAPTYYTYRFTGLPEGPICNPGVAAIEAALYPADTNYLFFVTDKEGAYHYSETIAEHDAICKQIRNS